MSTVFEDVRASLTRELQDPAVRSREHSRDDQDSAGSRPARRAYRHLWRVSANCLNSEHRLISHSKLSPRQGVLERYRHHLHVPAPRGQGARRTQKVGPSLAGKGYDILARLLRFAAIHLSLFPGTGLIPSDGLLHVQNAGSNRTSTHNKPASSFDALDHAFIIFKHPANYTTRMKDSWRRVDLIGANWASFGAAVLGWTGSTQFERDLRRHAHSMSVKRARLLVQQRKPGMLT